MARFPVNPSNQSRPSPEHFGPYIVLERLGMGGMAIVHHAKKQGIEGFERPVALKRLLSHLTEDPSFIKSFIREARLASLLQHVNVVQIYDLGRVGHVYFIAMEYIRGKDLRKILRHSAYATGPLPVGLTIALMGQMCDALHYAHSLCDDDTDEPLGIVHRDISPANAIVARDGNLKIIDFGIAKAQSAQLQSSTGRIKGKFAYMSPEAIMGKSLDGRSDLFSMGIVMHELLTSRPLFAVKNQFETLKRVRGMEVEPPSRWNPACPKELDDIVMTALAREVDQRWQTAGAMRSALDAVALQYGLRATNRDIAEYLRWAFEQPVSSERWDTNRQLLRPAATSVGSNPYQRLPPMEQPRSTLVQAIADSLSVADGGHVIDDLDHASIEIVWGKDSSGSEPSGTVQVDENMIALSIELPRHTLPPPGSGDMVRPAPMRSFLHDTPTSGDIPELSYDTADPALVRPQQPTILELVAAMEIATDNAADLYRSAARQFNAELDAGGPRTPTPAPMVPVGHHAVSLPPPGPPPPMPGPPPPAPDLPGYDETDQAPDDIRADKDRQTKGLGIALTAVACVAAAIVGFVLVPGSGTSGKADDVDEGNSAGRPAMIEADAVRRVAGTVPVVTAPVDARVCIDESGAVTSVEITSGSSDGVSEALEQWRYEPYSSDGTASAACFDTSLSP